MSGLGVPEEGDGGGGRAVAEEDAGHDLVAVDPPAAAEHRAEQPPVPGPGLHPPAEAPQLRQRARAILQRAGVGAQGRRPQRHIRAPSDSYRMEPVATLPSLIRTLLCSHVFWIVSLALSCPLSYKEQF